VTTYLAEHSDLKLHVGARPTTVAVAEQYVRRYLNTPTEHWSYPAYDGYPGSLGADVGLQDLFAPTLLNAPIRKLRSYYELEQALPELNERLRDVRDDVSLARATAEDIRTAARVFGIFDVRPDIHGVKLTTLAKIVHRKRPLILPLWDEHIERCYHTDPDAPVPYEKGRAWEEFAVAWLQAVKADLTATPEIERAWRELAALTPPGGPTITPLRALDIVGWRLGRMSAA